MRDVDSAPKFAPLSVGSSLAGAAVVASWIVGLALAHYPAWRLVAIGVVGSAMTIGNLVAARMPNKRISPYWGRSSCSP